MLNMVILQVELGIPYTYLQLESNVFSLATNKLYTWEFKFHIVNSLLTHNSLQSSNFNNLYLSVPGYLVVWIRKVKKEREDRRKGKKKDIAKV